MDQTINVNITPGQFRPSLHYSQGDVGRVFKIQVVDFDIPAGSTVQCVATKPSGLGFTLAGTVSGNEITFVTTDAVTDEWGRFPAEVKIINGGNVIGTANFLMIGEKNPHPDTTIDGKQEEFIPLLTLLVERIEAAAEDVDAQVPVVQQAADDAAASAAAASDSADSASDSATSASGSANEASNSAIAAAASASSAATSAEDAKESAEAFVGENYVEDTRPYLFRQTGDGAQGVGTRERLKSIVGATVAWNQLVQNGNFASDTLWNYSQVASHSTANNILTFTASAREGLVSQTLQMAIIDGHKYLALASVKTSTESTDIRLEVRNGNGVVSVALSKNTTSWQTLSGIFNGIAFPTPYIRILDNRSSGWDAIQTTNIMLFDLTAMFGSTIADYIYSLEQANAGAGVAWFKKLFNKPYYAYNAGELMSVKALRHITRGFNAWDEEWEVGSINSLGNPSPATDKIRSKNFNDMLPNTAYYGKAPNTLGMRFYDADKNYLGSVNGTNSIFTSPANTRYFKLVLSNATAYSHDICINLSDSAKNGTYEPYIKHSYPLDSSLTLRGLLKLTNGKLYADGDEYKADGNVNRRYGVVDLGTLDWTYVSDDNVSRMASSALTDAKAPSGGTAKASIICAKYMTESTNDVYLNVSDKIIGLHAAQKVLWVYDSAYTDAASFKTAMSGVYLVYELATPTTESADPYTELQICDPLGTEEFATDGIVPVGNVTQYPEDLKAKLEGLPWNFSTLIALTEATSTASRAYAIGDYLILNNVLYKVTAAISSGGTITVGTNVTATTVTDEIKALRS